jgi:hypothetical protein
LRIPWRQHKASAATTAQFREVTLAADYASRRAQRGGPVVDMPTGPFEEPCSVRR